jgi:SAM-dependent MidA family methyltransferase
LGTLQCHFKHTIASDPLARVGRQDISAHVDFTAVDDAMAASGFEAIANVSQTELLGEADIGAYLDRLIAAGLPQQDIQANQYALRALVEPEGLGRFRVAVHGRNAPRMNFPEIDSPTVDKFADVTLPALDADPRRVNLFTGAFGGGNQSMGTWGEIFGE